MGFAFSGRAGFPYGISVRPRGRLVVLNQVELAQAINGTLVIGGL